jgi:hypothetical protein
MKELKTSFNKNGLEYTLLKRNQKIALFRLGPAKYADGYEVSRIYVMRPHKAFGVYFEESEIISSNDQFIEDGSGSFRYLRDALRHYDKMTDKLVRKDNVDDISDPDTELIPEYQAVGDNVL